MSELEKSLELPHLPDVLEIGEIVDRYRVEARLGAGGLAVVYRVRHIHLDTQHALKVLLVATPLDRARLLAEGQVQANLHHPHVVAVSDVLTVHRAPALIMELVEGPTLERTLAQRESADPGEPRRIPVAIAHALFRGIVSGVGAAHAAGLVHRDLKPANVLLKTMKSGVPLAKVTDFGLVRSVHASGNGTSSGAAVGTPAYMSPEQIRSPSTVDARADLWALGAILYELLHGQRAFSDTDPFALYQAISEGRHRAIDRRLVDARSAEAIESLLVVDPLRRLSSCAELWEQLWDDPPPNEWSTESPLSLRPMPSPLAPPMAKSSAPSAPRLWGAALLAVLVLTVSLAAAVLGWQLIRSRVVLPAETIPVEIDAPQPVDRLSEPVGTPVQPVLAPSVLPASPTRERAPTRALPQPVQPPSGQIIVEGDAISVWLEAGGQRFAVDAPVPVGTYNILARWETVERPAGTVQITEGATTRLRCSSFVYACVSAGIVETPSP